MTKISKKPENQENQKDSRNIPEVYKKLLQAVRLEFPGISERDAGEIAAKRTMTWKHALEDPDDIGVYFSLFEDVGELSNLRIEQVTVEYPTEPSLTLELSFKGKRYLSHLDLDESRRELEFAIKNQIPGSDKFQNTMERLEMEMIDTRKVRKVGNSLIVSIPDSVINLFGIKDGDYLSFIYRYGEVKVKKEKNVS